MPLSKMRFFQCKVAFIFLFTVYLQLGDSVLCLLPSDLCSEKNESSSVSSYSQSYKNNDEQKFSDLKEEQKWQSEESVGENRGNTGRKGREEEKRKKEKQALQNTEVALAVNRNTLLSFPITPSSSSSFKSKYDSRLGNNKPTSNANNNYTKISVLNSKNNRKQYHSSTDCQSGYLHSNNNSNNNSYIINTSKNVNNVNDKTTDKAFIRLSSESLLRRLNMFNRSAVAKVCSKGLEILGGSCAHVISRANIETLGKAISYTGKADECRQLYVVYKSVEEDIEHVMCMTSSINKALYTKIWVNTILGALGFILAIASFICALHSLRLLICFCQGKITFSSHRPAQPENEPMALNNVLYFSTKGEETHPNILRNNAKQKINHSILHEHGYAVNAIICSFVMSTLGLFGGLSNAAVGLFLSPQLPLYLRIAVLIMSSYTASLTNMTRIAMALTYCMVVCSSLMLLSYLAVLIRLTRVDQAESAADDAGYPKKVLQQPVKYANLLRGIGRHRILYWFFTLFLSILFVFALHFSACLTAHEIFCVYYEVYFKEALHECASFK